LVVTKRAVDSTICQEKIWFLLTHLGIQHKDIKLYILSFIHRSIVNERNDFAPQHNERLEFLWDAVLELVITHKLFDDYPEKQEWEMTDMRSALVRGRNLAEVAKKLDFQEYLYLWKWEEKSGWRDNDYILANTVESFIWALYLDNGFKSAESFIIKQIYSTLPKILKEKLFKDFKTLLQELTQADRDITPHYEVISDSGPDHDKNFHVWVYLKTEKIGEWTGTSKKKAQESAAENAYTLLTS
jgi:ribonuclease-3